MKSEILAHFPYIWLTCAALLLFFFLFVAAVIWVFRRSSTSLYRYVENLPLQEGPSL